MRKKLEIEIKVGLFVAIGVILLAGAIIMLGSSEDMLDKKVRYHALFPNVEGMIEGAKVVVGGVRVGTVKKIDFDPEKHQIRVDMEVVTRGAGWIRQDSSAELTTQGMLGDKYVTISSGSMDLPQLAPKSEIPAKPSQDLGRFLTKGDQLMASLTSISTSMDHILKTFEAGGRSEAFFHGMSQSAKNMALATEKLNHELDQMNLAKTSKSLNQILEKVNNGTGTLGALVNDASLYDDIKALAGGANRNRVVRNLVRQTIKKSEEAEASQK